MTYMALTEAFKARGLTESALEEAIQSAKDLRAAGYNNDTIAALYESYLEEGTTITGKFTLEKLNMAIDPDGTFVEFWEGTNA